jgi:hypothetical protein
MGIVFLAIRIGKSQANRTNIADSKGYTCMRRSQWQRRLRRRCMAARLLQSWVRIPPAARMFVCCVCCLVEVSATSWSLVQRNPIDCGAPLCVIKKPRERGCHNPRWTAEPEKIIIIIIICKDCKQYQPATVQSNAINRWTMWIYEQRWKKNKSLLSESCKERRVDGLTKYLPN